MMATEADPTTVTIAELSDAERAAASRIRSWRRFHHRVRRRQSRLLPAIGKYPRCVLVAGCQRSGTTMLTRIIAGARGFSRFAFTHDDELDAALILADLIDLSSGRRYCFQTTYLNEAFGEYGTMREDQRLIWVVRNPYSVVYSMVYHWKRFALNELYGSAVARSPDAKSLGPLPWPIGPRIIERACIAYAWKTRQIHAIRKLVPADRLLVTDYHDLVQEPAKALGRIFEFIGEPFRSDYVGSVSRESLAKADRLTARERALIDEIAVPAYDECRVLAYAPPGHESPRGGVLEAAPESRLGSERC